MWWTYSPPPPVGMINTDVSKSAGGGLDRPNAPGSYGSEVYAHVQLNKRHTNTLTLLNQHCIFNRVFVNIS